MGKIFSLLISVFIIIIAVIITMNNNADMTIDLYLYEYVLPVPILILISFISGVVLSFIFLLSLLLTTRKRLKELKILSENNQEEIDNLRRNPLRDGSE